MRKTSRTFVLQNNFQIVAIGMGKFYVIIKSTYEVLFPNEVIKEIENPLESGNTRRMNTLHFQGSKINLKLI